MNFFYDIDQEKYLTEKEIITSWYNFNREEYPEYSHYLQCCMTSENGSLETLQQRENHLQRELNRLKKQDYDTIPDQIYYENEIKKIHRIEETGKAFDSIIDMQVLFYDCNNNSAYETAETLKKEIEVQLIDLLANE